MVNELFRLGNFQCRKVLVITRPGSVFTVAWKKWLNSLCFHGGPACMSTQDFTKPLIMKRAWVPILLGPDHHILSPFVLENHPISSQGLFIGVDSRDLSIEHGGLGLVTSCRNAHILARPRCLGWYRSWVKICPIWSPLKYLWISVYSITYSIFGAQDL